MQNRQSLDEALANMFSSPTYASNALFYVHLITQMKVIIKPDLPAPAGVGFKIDHYVLYINEEKFAEYSLNDRIFILIHECLHILCNHVKRNTELNRRWYNIASDCAINQMIKSLDVPSNAIMPHTEPFKDLKAPKLAIAETYYDLLKNEVCEDCGQHKKSKKQASAGQEICPACGNPLPEFLDTHDEWQTIEGEKQLQDDITTQMIEKSIAQTQNAKGNLPKEISEWLNTFAQNSQVNWKKVLKNMVGNKKIGKRLTIMRRSRRFPDRLDIKGNVKDRKFNLVCFVDISGSMSDDQILTGLNEIHHICKQNHTSMKLIQIDTEVHKVQEFDVGTKLFERSGNGGTVMESGIKYLFENKIPHDGIIFISDMYIEDIKDWEKQPSCRVIWLSTTGIIPYWNGFKKHLVLPLEVK